MDVASDISHDQDADRSSLVAASYDDLKPCRTIYVHKRRAVITTVDFPLVYYQIEGESVVKHRSFKSSRDLFEVPSVMQSSTSPASPPSTNDSTEASTPGSPHAALNFNNFADHNPQSYDSAFSSSSSTSSASTSSNLLAAFASRPKKFVIENKKSTDVTCDASAPSGVYISKCEDVTVSIAKKVSSVTLHGCKNIKVFFSSTIQNAEIIKSTSCNLTCTLNCPLWHLEDAEDCNITFPGSIDTVSIVSVNSQHTRAIARAEEADEDDEDDEDDEEEERKERAKRKESVTYDLEEPFPVANATRNLCTTHWKSHLWAFSPLVPLNREGDAGYATNL